MGEATTRQVQLYNEQGQVVRSIFVSTSELTLSVANLPSGTYLVRVSQPDEERPTTLRLVVVH